MANTDTVTLFHSPNTRSSTTRLLLEELGAPYEIHVVDHKKGENHKPDYLAINPLGKVPAIRHNGGIVTESVAIMIYLADAFPAAGLAPKIGDPLRGPYLRWMAMYGSAWEPAVVDRAQKRDPGQRAMSPYGDFDTLYKIVTDQLEKGPYMLGQTYSAVDVLWGSALTWMTMFKLLPEHPAVAAYIARGAQRPAVIRTRAKDQELAAKLA
jgi:glutathione S-transferase